MTKTSHELMYGYACALYKESDVLIGLVVVLSACIDRDV